MFDNGKLLWKMASRIRVGIVFAVKVIGCLLTVYVMITTASI